MSFIIHIVKPRYNADHFVGIISHRKQIEVFFGNRIFFFKHCGFNPFLQSGPEFCAYENHGNRADFFSLYQGEYFKHLVKGTKAPRVALRRPVHILQTSPSLQKK
jgi:hypothetical protein